MTHLVDLDDIAGLERAWQQLRRVKLHRAVDPELRADIERLLPKMDAETASEIRAALDEIHPAIALNEWWTAICEARFGDTPKPGLWTLRRPEHPVIDYVREIRESDAADPRQLADRVRDLARFTDDVARIAELAITHSRGCGISDAVAAPIIARGLREMNKRVAHGS